MFSGTPLRRASSRARLSSHCRASQLDSVSQQLRPRWLDLCIPADRTLHILDAAIAHVDAIDDAIA
jgi:hypothetical protein